MFHYILVLLILLMFVVKLQSGLLIFFLRLSRFYVFNMSLVLSFPRFSICTSYSFLSSMPGSVFFFSFIEFHFRNINFTSFVSFQLMFTSFICLYDLSSLVWCLAPLLFDLLRVVNSIMLASKNFLYRSSCSFFLVLKPLFYKLLFSVPSLLNSFHILFIFLINLPVGFFFLVLNVASSKHR